VESVVEPDTDVGPPVGPDVEESLVLVVGAASVPAVVDVVAPLPPDSHATCHTHPNIKSRRIEAT
jgi:hypothetical protein